MTNERNTTGKIASVNQDEYNLEDPEKNKTEEPVYLEQLSAEDYVDVGTMNEEIESDAVPDRHNEESIDNIEKYSADFGTMN